MQGKTFFRIWTALLAAALLAGCGSERTDNMRLLYWNIQNGMWSDQGNNYSNFVAWVKKYDPDVCIWCESASIYKNNTNSGAPKSERFLATLMSASGARPNRTTKRVPPKKWTLRIVT